MSDQLIKNFSIEIQQKLYEKSTPQGNLAVYQTSPFGMMLTINDHVMISERDGFLYHEMMAHPVLFTHPNPQTIAIVGNCFGILQEVLKHNSVKQVYCVMDNVVLDEVVSQYFSPLYQAKNDERVQYHIAEPQEWFKQCGSEMFDVIIQAYHPEDCLPEHYQRYHQALSANGIFIQPCQSTLLQMNTLKPVYQNIQQAGFHDWRLLNFPQPSYPSGWRTVMMATKQVAFKRVREKEVFNRGFGTRYYNFDVHQAAMVVPEFVREELNIL